MLLRAFGGHMVSRADLARWPLVGPAARAVGTVFVDRSDAVSGAAAVRAIRTRLAQGSTVIVVPGGAPRSPTTTSAPSTPARSSRRSTPGPTSIPVGLAYATGSGAAFVNESFPAHLRRMAAADPSTVAMCIGRSHRDRPKARAARLRDEAHAEVQRLVHEARRMVDDRG